VEKDGTIRQATHDHIMLGRKDALYMLDKKKSKNRDTHSLY